MRIGLISDTHGNLDGWRQAWELALSRAELIVHCGDVLYHGPKFAPTAGYEPKALAAAINAVSVPVLIARGNGDSEVDQLVLDIPLQSPYLLAEWGGLRLLATHGHLMAVDDLTALAQKWRVDYLLTGHTHVPMVREVGTLVHVNPGTVSYPLAAKEELHRLTCGVIEDDTVRVLDVETGEPLPLTV
jgi:putative phosphoesterase